MSLETRKKVKVTFKVQAKQHRMSVDKKKEFLSYENCADYDLYIEYLNLATCSVAPMCCNEPLKTLFFLHKDIEREELYFGSKANCFTCCSNYFMSKKADFFRHLVLLDDKQREYENFHIFQITFLV